jgi:hypothetical protein
MARTVCSSQWQRLLTDPVEGLVAQHMQAEHVHGRTCRIAGRYHSKGWTVSGLTRFNCPSDQGWETLLLPQPLPGP